MSNGKATVSFFENGSTTQFEYCYKMYPQVLKLKAEKRCKKPQELIRLDHWYQNDLPGLIKARGKDAHLLYDELVQTMKWKQSRGKFYPQLSYLVKVNTPRAVVQETKKAFRKLPNLEQAITALSNLKGVGTTMASALLAAAAPHLAPFMADECLMAIPEIEGIDYTTKEYLNFVQHIQATVERLNAEVGGDTPHWSSHRVELALWAHYVANDLSPELLDDMPPPGTGVNSNAGAAISTNGSNKISDGDDTNDGVAVDLDDESLGAGGRHTAAESETDNENTNPAPLLPNINNSGVAKMNNTSASTAVGAALQDGDSNFVSNDSTSQEPIIDDNDGTTQTTATTTSTEDGEPTAIGIGGNDGTPLASDSESNLEAPLKSNNRLQAAQQTAAAAVATHNNNSSSKQQPQVINNGQAAAAAPVSTPAAAAAASVTTPAQAPPKSAAAANGNGNGVLGNDVDDEDDDEDDEEDEDDDEELDEEDEDNDDELEADESNSSSGILRDSSKLQQLQATAAAAAAGGETVPAIGQKRAALHCDGGAIGGSDGSVGGGGGGDTKSPDLKKLRSE